MKRNIYLKSTDLKDITPIIDKVIQKYKVKFETVNVIDSLNRISFEARVHDDTCLIVHGT